MLGNGAGFGAADRTLGTEYDMNQISLDGKVILVTGAARSIGAGMADEFASAGATVIRTDVDDSADGVQRLDVTREDDWKAVVDEVVAEHGRLDGLVNNAALVYRCAPMWEEPLEEFESMLAVNVKGVWLGLQTASKAMASTGGGSIVNLSSTSGVMAARLFSGYGVTRWAVRGMSKHAAHGLAEHSIRVNSVHPHGIAGSGMVEKFLPTDPDEQRAVREAAATRNPLGRQGTIADVSSMVAYLLSDLSTWITGREFVVDGGATLTAAQ